MPYSKYSVWTTKEVAYIENKRLALVDNYMFPNASEIVRGACYHSFTLVNKSVMFNTG